MTGNPRCHIMVDRGAGTVRYTAGSVRGRGRAWMAVSDVTTVRYYPGSAPGGVWQQVRRHRSGGRDHVAPLPVRQLFPGPTATPVSHSVAASPKAHPPAIGRVFPDPLTQAGFGGVRPVPVVQMVVCELKPVAVEPSAHALCGWAVMGCSCGVLYIIRPPLCLSGKSGRTNEERYIHSNTFQTAVYPG